MLRFKQENTNRAFNIAPSTQNYSVTVCHKIFHHQITSYAKQQRQQQNCHAPKQLSVKPVPTILHLTVYTMKSSVNNWQGI